MTLVPPNEWSDGAVAGLTEIEALTYRSHLLGSDPTIVNFGGGNTSIKTQAVDHAGRPVSTLWVKGSGWDLGTITADGFTPLRLDDVAMLESRSEMDDDEVVDYLQRCMLDPKAPRPSIETTLHAFIADTHVDHTHPEAAIAFCCAEFGEKLVGDCFGDEAVWVPYVRPGFGLAKLAVAARRRNPNATAMFLAKHGLVTWGSSSQESYERTISVLQRAHSFLQQHIDIVKAFGGRRIPEGGEELRRTLAVSILPRVRGALSEKVGRRLILSFDDSRDVRQFVDSNNMPELAGTGAACPDHVMYTKFLPVVVDAPKHEEWDPVELEEAITRAVDSYAEAYRTFFAEHTDGVTEPLDPAPRVVLIPGLGMITAGWDKWAALNTASLYRSAISVMLGAASVTRFTSLTPEEAWNVEYWPLELSKLATRSSHGDLESRIALITGGAGAIGSATARRLLAAGAHIVISDLDAHRAAQTAAALASEFPHRIVAVGADAGSEDDTTRVLETSTLEFGGLDLAVPNAGIAGAHPIDETSVDEWRRVQDVLLLGYFLTCRAAFTVFKRQGLGGVIVINSSKNGLAAGKNAIAYTTAKAAETHMCRCLAEEGGPFGIRVNAVAPDAIITDSGFWTKEWREERSRTYGFPVEDIEEYYRQRNALKVNVEARDVAETILWLASDRSGKTTGCIVTIDGGLMATYPR